MARGNDHSPHPAAGRRRRRTAARAAILAAAMAVAACSPVEAWRDLTGASRNDPDPETALNTENLAAGEASSYPNLATVPPPPTRALTNAEREKLTQSLIADRTNAKHTDEKLRAGYSAISAPVPPPPPPPAPASAEPADKTGKPAPAPAATDGEAPAAQAQGPRKEGEPPEPGPKESSLQAPQARETPTPEQNRPGPPPPRQVSMPAATPAGGQGAAHLPAPPGPAPLPAAIDTAKYQPPPPLPVLTQPAPTRAAAVAAPEKPPAPAVGSPVAEFKFAGASTSLAEGGQADVDKVVSSYRKEPGKLRVVGYAGVGSDAAEQLASYRIALDRAQAVAAALAKAGIPSDKILAEVAPAASDSGEGRAEVVLEH